MAENKTPKVSVIIATYNRAEPLRRTLRSLAAQTLDKSLWELVVVDNNSGDNTPAVIDEFIAAHPEMCVRRFVEMRQGVSHARNRAFTESRGEVIVSIDDDEEAFAEFVEVYYDFFESHPHINAAGGDNVPRYDECPRPEWMSKYTETPIAALVRMGDKRRPFSGGRFFMGGNMAMRRGVFEKYGLLHGELGRTGSSPLAGEEKEFFFRMQRAGEEIWFLPEAKVYHIIPAYKLTRQYFLNLCYMTGRSEKIRTQKRGRWAYFKRVCAEQVKWWGTLVIALGYILKGERPKAKYLIDMRMAITQGLFSE